MNLRLSQYKQIFGYGICVALLVLLMRWLEVKFLIIQHSFEVYAGAIAIVFTLLGVWLALKLAKPKVETKIVEKEIFISSNHFVFSQENLARLKLSNRELEVLQLIADGHSNQEIADKLFVSLNTIKTHITRLFDKLEVSRRTQAIEKAKKLSLIA